MMVLAAIQHLLRKCTFRAPGEVARVEAQRAVLNVASTAAHQMNALSAKLQERIAR